MTTHRNYYLRMYRKRSQLTQSDIAFLLGLPEHSNISHWEKGRRTPNIEIVMLYQVLFEIPVESLFSGHTEKIAGVIPERISLLIKELQTLYPTPKVTSRIAYLDATLKRLTA